jgi:hypothetical protein
MEQSPSREVNSRCAGQGIAQSLLFNTKVHCHIQMSSTPEPVLSQFYLFYNLNFHILLLGLQISVLPQIVFCITCPVHPNLLRYITLIIFIEGHNSDALRYAVLSNLLPHNLSYAQIFPSAPHSQTQLTLVDL